MDSSETEKTIIPDGDIEEKGGKKSPIQTSVTGDEEKAKSPMETNAAADDDDDVTSKVQTPDGESTLLVRLQEAIREGQIEKVKDILQGDNAALRTAEGPLGLLPLQQAVVYRHANIVKHIISHFPDVINLTDNMKRTALHYAVGAHDDGVIYTILQEAGADDTFQDITGKTPKDYEGDTDSISSTAIQLRIQELLKAPTDTRPESADNKQAENEAGAEVTTCTTEVAVEMEANKTEEPAATEPPKPATPPGPRVHKPINMYVKAGGVNQKMAPPPSTSDGKYIAQQLGTALTLALAEIAEKRPWDPVEYLAKWLYKYHDNEMHVKKQAGMLKNIREEEARLNMEEELKFKRKEELLRIQEDEARKRKEEEEERRRKEMEELQRSNKEANLAQKPQLPTVTEDEEAEAEGEPDDDPNVKDRDTNGQTEMHKLASQEGVDLPSLIDLGYSIADRDVQGRSVRDVAKEAGQTGTVKAIDAYVKRLMKDGIIDTLETLLLQGYDDGINNLTGDDLPEVTKNFLQKMETLQDQASTAIDSTTSGKIEELEEVLEANPKLGSLKDKQGHSLLHLAILSDFPTVVQAIVSRFPQIVNSRDNANRSPLHYAYAISDELVAILLSKQAKSNAKDVYKRNPTYYKDNKLEIISQMPSNVSIPVVDVTVTDETKDIPTPKAEGEEEVTTNAEETNNEGEGDQPSLLATTMSIPDSSEKIQED